MLMVKSTLTIHRAPLQQLLVEAAQEAGVDIQVNTRILGIDETGPSPIAIAKDGRRIEADLIIGADGKTRIPHHFKFFLVNLSANFNTGAKSTIRTLLFPDIQLSSSINCYRAVIPGDSVKSDPDLVSLLDSSNIWCGPERTVVCLSVQNGTMLSVECPHPGNSGTAGDWNKPGDVELLKQTYSDFSPVVRKLLTKIEPENLLVWKLNQLPELKTWVFGSGKVVLLGDGKYP